MAEGSADERLVVMLEARIKDFEKRMAQAERSGTKTYQGLQRGSKTMTTQMEQDLARSGARLNSILAGVTTRIGALSAAAAAAAVVGLAAMTAASIRNIDAQAKQARSLDLSTAAFQRMSMIAREAGIEAGGLSAMLGIMQRQIAASSEAFAQLGLSAQDLIGLDADQQFARIAAALDAVANPAEKTRLAMEIFGRSGRNAINMLSDFSGKSAEAAAFQERFGVAVRQSNSDAVERANDAWGRLGMVMEGVGNRIAVVVAPAIEWVANRLIDMAGAIIGVEAAADRFRRETAEAAADVGDAFRGLGPQIEVLSDMLRAMGNESAAQAFDAILAGMDASLAAFAEGRIGVEQFKSEFSAAAVEAERVLSTLSAVEQAQLSGIIGRVGELFAALRSAADEAVRLAASLPENLETTEGDGSSIISWAPDRNAPRTRPMPSGGDLRDEGGRRGGGGRGKGRLDGLLSQLQTERETLTAWYAESLELLQSASDAELAVLGGKHEAVERLEMEHRARLAEVRDRENAAVLEAQSGMYNGLMGLLSAFGSRSKSVALANLAVNTALRVREVQQNSAAAQVRALAERGPVAGAAAAASIRGFAAIQSGLIVAAGVLQGASMGGSRGGGGAGSSGGGGGGGSSVVAAPREVALTIAGLDRKRLYEGEAVIELTNAVLREIGNQGAVIRYV